MHDRGKHADGIKSFHIRHSRKDSQEKAVGEPVHVIFYRVVTPGLVEIVRVLHERIEPDMHLQQAIEEGDD